MASCHPVFDGIVPSLYIGRSFVGSGSAYCNRLNVCIWSVFGHGSLSGVWSALDFGFVVQIACATVRSRAVPLKLQDFVVDSK